MQNGDIVVHCEKPSERNGDCLAAGDLLVDIPGCLCSRHLLIALTHQPHLAAFGIAALVGEQNLLRRCDVYRSDTHRINGSAPVEVRLVIVDCIAVIRTAEIRIYIRKSGKRTVAVNIKSVDALTVGSKSIIAGLKQRDLRSAGRDLQHLRHEGIQLFAFGSLHSHCRKVAGKLVALRIQRCQIVCNAHVVTSTIAASAVSTPDSSVSTADRRLRISEMEVLHPCIS